MTRLHLLSAQLSGRPRLCPFPIRALGRRDAAVGSERLLCAYVNLCDKRVCGRGLQISATTELLLELEAQADRDIGSDGN